MVSNNTWTPTPRSHTPAGWNTHDAREKAHLHRNKSWLASFVPGSDRALPFHGRGEKHPWESMDSVHSPSVRLRSMKRSLVRKVSSWSQTGPLRSASLTRPPSSPLPAPSASTVRFVLLCALWYTTSALSSNTGKVILTQFRYPITLTFVQFGFVAAYCLLFMSPVIRFSNFKQPSKAIFNSTIPMGFFQVGGHIFSSMAISRIPVSTVHTIKALSPLFTVAAYALLFRVRYSAKTYMSLLPLTIGVMLACSHEMMSLSNAVGLLCAFGSALVFVSSNIFFKKIMPSGTGASGSSHKLDKLNLLFYSSSVAFVLMIPIWAYYDLPVLLAMMRDPAHVAHPSQGHVHAHHSVAYSFVANGTVHFAQNIIAFVLLAQTSPVTYSIASLVKRVAVICIAIAWFAQPVHPLQACGIAMTFAGLYMYNQAKGDVEQGERSMRRVAASRALELPSNRAQLSPTPTPASAPTIDVRPDVAVTSGYGRPRAQPHLAPAPHPLSQPSHRPQPPSYSQTHTAPNLRIQITPPAPPGAKPGAVPTPVDLYPSPPPSLDSPPADDPIHANPWPANRRSSMATGHVPPRHYETSAPRAAVAA